MKLFEYSKNFFLLICFFMLSVNAVFKKNELYETLLHYVLKQSHHLYPASENSNDDYADFVLGLIKEVHAIDTPKENLIKIIDLAISSISSYEETRNKPSIVY